MMNRMNGGWFSNPRIRPNVDARQGQADLQHRLCGYFGKSCSCRMDGLMRCADENTTLNDCFRDKKDWRACKDEVSRIRICWRRPTCARSATQRDHIDQSRSNALLTEGAIGRWRRSNSAGNGRETSRGPTRRTCKAGGGERKWPVMRRCIVDNNQFNSPLRSSQFCTS